MIKLIACPKITKRELMTALMEGRRFCVVRNENDNAHDMIEWDENYGNNPVRNGAKNWDWRGFCFLHEITESHWYEDPNMYGKPVKVRDEEDQEWGVDIFIGLDTSNSVYKFECANYHYVLAEPLTPADLYQEPV